MQIVIDIPEDIYQYVANTGTYGHYRFNSARAIRNGTPLEKHDEEVIKETVESIWGKPPYTELLDKIRAEIIWYRDNKLSYEANSETIELTNYYLGVIDKYREEQE